MPTNIIQKSICAKAFTIAACLCATILLQGCNRSMENTLLGRQWDYVNGHEIVVTDCYKTGREHAQTIEDTPEGSTHRFAPCRDAEVIIKHEELIVNGKSYGKLNRGDKIVVDHGKVLINEKDAIEVASK